MQQDTSATKVYPRVGGGTASAAAFTSAHCGLSPRGRGNRPHVVGIAAVNRSIPAWAGEPFEPCWWLSGRRVYPRVGGGTLFWARPCRLPNGLSPRGRGNPDVHTAGFRTERSIPAWAGEPRLHSSQSCPRAVYPRVGGGTLPQMRNRRGEGGLSPRGRGNQSGYGTWLVNQGSIPAWAGEPYHCLGYSTKDSGLSPRGRGNLSQCSKIHLPRRSIPAWAGEPPAPPLSPRPIAVYPRVGGGTGRTSSGLLRSIGLSPRGRGEPFEPCWWLSGTSGLSPRGRGNPLLGPPMPTPKRSIPAWAGEPRCPHGWLSHRKVYPRVGGGTDRVAVEGPHQGGLSPRGRGNLQR